MADSKGKQGFATMDPDRQREIAAKGGRAAHATGAAHEFTPVEAMFAGRKGGLAVSRDRDYMSRIGRKGGAAKNGKRKQPPAGGVG